MNLETLSLGEVGPSRSGKIALLTSKILCKSLIGSLTETENSNQRYYQASFIAKTEHRSDLLNDARSQKPEYGKLLNLNCNERQDDQFFKSAKAQSIHAHHGYSNVFETVTREKNDFNSSSKMAKDILKLINPPNIQNIVEEEV